MTVCVLASMVISARAGFVEEWSIAFEESVQLESTPPALAARNLAILHVAIHDAYVLSTGSDFPIMCTNQLIPDVDIDAAVAAYAAGHDVCRRLFPSRSTEFDSVLVKALLPHRTEPYMTASLRLGRAVSGAVLTTRASDGSTTQMHYVPQEGPGAWRRTTLERPPELPHWPQVKPFVLPSADAYRPSAPLKSDSKAFAQALEEVRALGGRSSTTRSETHTRSAHFWSDFSYTTTPPGHWNRIARRLAQTQQLSEAESTRLFALLNLAMADAGIAAFDCKYAYNYWRPVTALGMSGVAEWESLLPSPSHPEYVSAHAAFSGAAAVVLAAFFGEELMPFSVTSDAVPGLTRTYDDFDACVEEVVASRVYGGIHYSFSGAEGIKMGTQVGTYVLKCLLWSKHIEEDQHE